MYGKSACPVLGGAGEQLKVWLRYYGTAGKPGGERIKQTSAYSHGKPPVYSTNVNFNNFDNLPMT